MFETKILKLRCRYRVLLVSPEGDYEQLVDAPDAMTAALRAEDPSQGTVTHLLVKPVAARGDHGTSGADTAESAPSRR